MTKAYSSLACKAYVDRRETFASPTTPVEISLRLGLKVETVMQVLELAKPQPIGLRTFLVAECELPQDRTELQFLLANSRPSSSGKSLQLTMPGMLHAAEFLVNFQVWARL